MEEARLLNLVESTAEAFGRLEAEFRQHEYFFVEAALRAIRLDVPGFQWRKQEAGNGGHGRAPVPQQQLVTDLDDDDAEEAPQHVQHVVLDADQENALEVPVEVDKHMLELSGVQVRAKVRVESTVGEKQYVAAEEDGKGLGAEEAGKSVFRELQPEAGCSCSRLPRRTSVWDILNQDVARVKLGGAGERSNLVSLLDEADYGAGQRALQKVRTLTDVDMGDGSSGRQESGLDMCVSLGLDGFNLGGVEVGHASALPLTQLPGSLKEAESCEVGLVVKAPTCVYMVEGRVSRMSSREAEGTVKFAVDRFSKQEYVRDARRDAGAKSAWHHTYHSADAGSSKTVEKLCRLEAVQETDGLEDVKGPFDSVTAALTEHLEESNAELGAETVSQLATSTVLRASGGFMTSRDWQRLEDEDRIPMNPTVGAGSMDWQPVAEEPEQSQDCGDIDMLAQEVMSANHLQPSTSFAYADDPNSYEACGHSGQSWGRHCETWSDVPQERAARTSTDGSPAEEQRTTQGLEDELDEHQAGFICDNDHVEPDIHVRNCNIDDEGKCVEKVAIFGGVSSLRYSGASEKTSGIGSSGSMDFGVAIGGHPRVSAHHPATHHPGEGDVQKLKRPNVVERGSIRSFLPLLKQQPAAPAARPVKVWALEAAQAARRQEEQKAMERKMRKEHQKLLKDQQLEERAKQLREEVRQIKEYAKQQQLKKEDTQKKDKPVDEQKVERDKQPEPSRSLQDSDVGSKGATKLSVTAANECTSKKRQFTSADNSKPVLTDCSNTLSNAQAKVNRVLEAKQRIDLEKARKLEEDRRRKEEEWKKKESELAAKKRGRQETEKKLRDVKRKMQKEIVMPYRENVVKQVHDESRDQENACTWKCEDQGDAGLDGKQPQTDLEVRENKCSPDTRTSALAPWDVGVQSYEISPYRPSDDEEDEDESLPQKPIPLWARLNSILHYKVQFPAV